MAVRGKCFADCRKRFTFGAQKYFIRFLSFNMAGLYIHIPFCKTRCAYCDFYSSTTLSDKSLLTDAICNEMDIRKNYLQNQKINSIYFGGGTPSLLSEDDFGKIFAQINRLFLSTDSTEGWCCTEITLEANPDDLSEAFLTMLRQFPFNRISIGIQSFNDDELRLLNRRHSSEQAIQAIARCRKAGFNNISIDLMYGLPGQTMQTWQNTLQKAVEMKVEHISAYHLTYEPETVLGKMLAAGSINPLSEEDGLTQFSVLIKTLTNNEFEHYEISNFAKKSFRSRHNSAYWQGKFYLGIGPSAHSYDGESRQWNISDTKTYISSINEEWRMGNVECRMKNEELANAEQDSSFFILHSTFTKEILSIEDKYNDYIITRLRTVEGIDVSEINRQFGEKFHSYCLRQSEPFLRTEQLERQGTHIKTSASGIFISDYIMEKLIY
jgi:oxygen-independent coproporphyrinogen-3 oxidase